MTTTGDLWPANDATDINNLDALNNLDQMPVIFYEESCHTEIESDCQRSIHIGMTHIRLALDKIFLVCLATMDKIYVLNLKLTDQLQFFRQLSEQDLKFYSIRGDLANNRLLELAAIELHNLIDLTAFDIFLTMRKNSLTVLKSLSKEYTARVIDEHGLVYRDKYDLIKHWLGVSVSRKKRQDELTENNFIRDAPHSEAARNVIRARSCFNRALALRMNEDFKKLATLDTNNLYSFAVDINDEDYMYFLSQVDDREEIPYSKVMASLNRCTR